MTLLLDYTIKISIIVLAGLAASLVLRRRSAAGRHWVLSMTLVCALAFPLISELVPAWSGWPVVSRATIADVNATVAQSGAPRSTSREQGPVEIGIAVTAPGSQPLPGPSLLRILPFVWAAGATLSLLTLFVGLARLTWWSSRAQPVVDPAWMRALHEIGDRYRLRRPVVVLRSDHPSLLVTWGAWRPRVLVPHRALEWPEDRIRVVLCHELAHIRRGDWVMQIAGELVRSMHWFNPLIWIACTQLRHESEEACDDEVIAGGVDGPDYAAHLLDAARALKGNAGEWLPAPAIVRPSSLERRIRVMLTTRPSRTPATRRFRFVAALAVFATTAVVAAVQNGPAMLSGSVIDSTGAPVPEAAVRLTSKTSGATFQVKTDASGQFTFVPLPADDYALSARLEGFKDVEESVRLSGKPLRRDLKLALGEVKETINILGDSKAVAGDERTPPRAGAVIEVDPRPFERVLANCAPSSTGGRLNPPTKVRDVKPVYPASLQAAGITGTIVLTTTIGVDGRVANVDVVKSVHPELDAAAIEAVRQWLFQPTVLNCAPTETHMTVSLTFNVR